MRDASQRWPVAQVLLASVIVGLALGLFLLIRRVSGAIPLPLPPLLLIVTALGLVAWAVCVRLIATDSLIARWLPALVLLMFAIACSYPGARAIDWLAWLPALVAAGWPWKPRPARRSSPAAEFADVAPEQLLQQVTRFRAADGAEVISGTLLAEFAPGERGTTLYVAFCPPFETLPEVEAYVVDESLASVKLAQRLHHGAQLDVHLPEPAEESIALTIEFHAAAPEPR